jgi:hypothetical protein
MADNTKAYITDPSGLGLEVRQQNNPISVLDDPVNNNKSLFFPTNLDEIDHWVCFRVHSHELMRSTDFLKENTKAFIYLPIPNNLSTNYDQKYNDSALGFAGKWAADKGGDIGAMTDSLSGLARGEYDPDAVKYYATVVADENLTGFITGKIGGIPGALAGVAAEQAYKGALAAKGQTRNPHMAVMYEGPGFRKHKFEYKFVAKNLQESNTLRNIIYLFKYHMAPTALNNGHFFGYPEKFDIDFHYDSYLFNIGPSVLTSFDVNYHSEGQPLYFDNNDGGDVRSFFEQRDGGGGGGSESTKAPVSITLSMEFQEIFIIDKTKIQKDNR